MDSNFSYFSRAERIGIIVLLLLCVLLLIVPSFLPDQSQTETTDFSALVAQISAWKTDADVEEAGHPSSPNATVATSPTSFLANQATEEQLKAVGLSSRSVRAWLSYTRKGGKFKNWQDVEKFRALSGEERAAIQPYVQFADRVDNSDDTKNAIVTITENFNPNEIDKAGLIAMGVPAKVANNWTRFLASGGRFRRAEDIQKIYGLSATDFERLLPYTTVPTTAETTNENENEAFTESGAFPTSYDAPARNVIIDINTASAEEWQSLRGIGPAYSKRIVNFRDKLGGFHSVRQVAETYGLPDSVFQKIQIQLRPSPLSRKLPINTGTVEELAAHPYLRFSDARMIVNYREEHGTYNSAADLDKLYGLEEATKQRILPYLAF